MKNVVRPSYPLRVVHLVALWAYGVSQPVFSMLRANPEYLIVRGSSRAEVIAFTALVALGVPLLVVGAQLVVRRFSIRAADGLHLVFVGLFTIPVSLQLLKLVEPGSGTAILVVAAIAMLAAVAYDRFRAIRLFLTASIVLPLIAIPLFAFGVPVTSDAGAGQTVEVEDEAPVVFVVLDELPLSSLLTPDGTIDGERYPNFARLASDATWYPRATTVYDHTTHALPAMLDGRLPPRDSLPTVADHPNNLFTLLGESYNFNVFEPYTRLCPTRYCPREGSKLRRMTGLISDARLAYLHRVLPDSLAGRLPSVEQYWLGLRAETDIDALKGVILGKEDADRIDIVISETTGTPRLEFEQFLDSFRRGDRERTLHFLHLLLPHSPWHLLPSGREYGNARTIDGVEDDGDTWKGDRWLVTQAYQRHLLQVGYADYLLGHLLDRLEATGVYDRSLVVLLADHGVSFLPKVSRRRATVENIGDIAPIPLLIKLPGQETARVDGGAARTIDLVPTIADVLGIRLPWSVDGRSLLERRAAPTSVEMGVSDGTLIRRPWRSVERELTATVRRKSRLFGQGTDSLYELGTNTHLLGKAVEPLRADASAPDGAHFDAEDQLADVHLSSRFVPSHITGWVEGPEISRDFELAVAVNGRVVALTRAFRDNGQQRFAALVPESAFREGVNHVELFLIDGPRGNQRLVSLGRTGSARGAAAVGHRS